VFRRARCAPKDPSIRTWDRRIANLRIFRRQVRPVWDNAANNERIFPMTPIRCAWANPANPRYLAYHDEEWGVPCHDETRLFEMLNLEGAHAGLSWETILNKRDDYRAAFDNWDAEKIARYDADKVAQLLGKAGIVRNRLKAAAAITNPQAYLRLRDEAGGSACFCRRMWMANRFGMRRPAEVPARTAWLEAHYSSRRWMHIVMSSQNIQPSLQWRCIQA
jgi:DNA-3-methyladenine glycosylase I